MAAKRAICCVMVNSRTSTVAVMRSRRSTGEEGSALVCAILLGAVEICSVRPGWLWVPSGTAERD